jgi:hypothetical protein
MHGSCLCGEVVFEVGPPLTEIELCHCRKCRKAYGAPFAATLYGRKESFRWLRGEARVTTYDAAVQQSPPAYRHSFCARCGSALPLVWDALPFVEVPVACLDEPVAAGPSYQQFSLQRLAWVGDVGDLRAYEHAAPLREKVLRALV